MANAFNTQASHTELIPEQWMSDVILAATDHTANAFMANAVQLPSQQGKGKGDIYHFPIQSRVNMANITEGTALEYRQFSASEKTLTLNKNKGVVAHVSSILGALSGYDVFKSLAQQIGMNAGMNIDTDLALLYASAGITVTGTTAANITDALIQSAARQMDSAKAPRSAGGVRRFLIVDPTQMAALAGISTFSHADRVGNGDVIRTGLVGTIRGFDVFMGHNVQVTTDGFKHCVAGVYTPGNPFQSSLVWAPAMHAPMLGNTAHQDVEPMGLRTTIQYDQLNVGEALSGNQIYGVAAVRTEWLADIKVTDN